MKNLGVLRKNWEGLSGYIPVMLMLLFAMLTYWLLQITPRISREENLSQPIHEEDYFMKQFSLTTYEKNGQVKTYLVGNYARHYPDTDTIEIEGPQIFTQSFLKADRSQRSEGTAKTAYSNSDSSEIELRGGVVFIKKDEMKDGSPPVITKISGEYLKINPDIQQISSTQPVEIQRGLQSITANSMKYDNLERHLVMTGRVRSVFVKK